MAYQITTALRKLKILQKRIRGIAGGTSASKTISIIQILIDQAQRDTSPTLTSITSESFPHLKRGAIRDFLNIMMEHGYFKDALWNKTDYTYTFETGSKIEFFSLDQPHKVRGPRRDRLFINEANNIPYETFDQLEVRTKSQIWLDWNPVAEFWFYTDVAQRPDVEFMKLTYKDNEALDKQIVASIEARRDNKNWWAVYGLGELGEAEGRIYKGWQIIDDIPHEARLERYGLDFGYSNDPTAIIAIYRYNGGIILDEVVYQKGLSNKQISDILINQPRALVIADGAEPKSIDEIASYGIPILAANKGQGSILQGIQYVQDQRISVTKRSVNILKEYRNYLWETDKEGKIINEPIPIWNHCFVGSTLITTRSGYVPIRNISVGDEVLTSRGYRRVSKVWDNGLKQTFNYSLQFDTHSVNLTCTPEHKIKCANKWKPISKLQSGETLYLDRYSMERHMYCIQGKGISPVEEKECTSMCGSFTMAQLPRGFMSIIKMVTRGITELKTLSLKSPMSIWRNILGADLKTIPLGGRNSRSLGFSHLKSGTGVKRGLLGTKSTEVSRGLIVNQEHSFVRNVEQRTRQDTWVSANSVIQTAKLLHFEQGEGRKERVYDLTVEDCHEYFADGVLVHNCMDAVRYAIGSLQPQKTTVTHYNKQKWQI